MARKILKIVDCTPTWLGLFPLYEDWIYNGTPEQKKLVSDELKKLCIVADNLNRNKK